MNIKEYRKKTGLSQSQFAKKYGFNLRTLQDWEQERCNPPEYVTKMLKEIPIKISEFASTVTLMLESEKETFKELIENNDWDGIRDEIEEYMNNCDEN